MYRIGGKDENYDYIWWNMNRKGFLFRLIGLYSIIMGIIYGTIMLFGYYYQYVNNITMYYVSFIGIILGYIILLGALWLIIGGTLSFKKSSGFLVASLIITQLIIEVLSGFTIGIFFVPVTVILIISEIGYILKNSGQ
jgi:hypothetical protein